MVTRRYDVFLSHKSDYKPWVEWLAQALKGQRHTVFLDSWDLVPGSNWVAGLAQGLESSRAAVLVATPETVNSGWVQQEWASLMRRRVADPAFRLVPVVLGAMPDLPFLKDIQCVDGREPSRYRRWLHQILCGLAGVPPGEDVFGGDLPAPPAQPLQNQATQLAPAEARFVDAVMQHTRRANAAPLIVASRGRRHQGGVISLLRQQAQASYGSARVSYVVPPFSARPSLEDCFAELGRRCGFASPTPQAMAFVEQCRQRVDRAGSWFLLLAGFENAHAEFRRELASALREFSEGQPQGFRLVMVGGQKLVELKFGAGLMSLLTDCQLLEWPDPGAADLLAWQAQDYPGLNFAEAQGHALRL